MNDAPIIDYQDDACMFVRWNAIAFPVFGARMPSLRGVAAVASHIEAHGTRVGRGKLTEITLLGADVRMPDSDVRRALDTMAPKLAPYYGCVATVFEGDGFRAAVIRGMLTGFQLLGRLKYPHAVFDSVSECTKWVHGVELVEAPLSAVTEVAMKVRALGIERGVLVHARKNQTAADAP